MVFTSRMSLTSLDHTFHVVNAIENSHILVLCCSCAVYKLSIHVDVQEPDKPLQINHFPQIQGSESIKVAQAIRVIDTQLIFNTNLA